MGADDPAFGLWGPLTTREGGVSNLTKANSEFGSVLRDGTISYSRKFNSLMSQENKLWSSSSQEFDDGINTAGFRATITRLEDEIMDRTEREASFQVKVLHGTALAKNKKRAR